MQSSARAAFFPDPLHSYNTSKALERLRRAIMVSRPATCFAPSIPWLTPTCSVCPMRGTHVLGAFLGKSVTERGSTASPSSSTSQTSQVHVPSTIPESLSSSRPPAPECASLANPSLVWAPALNPCDLSGEGSPSIDTVVGLASPPFAGLGPLLVSACARHMSLNGHVEQEGLLTVQTVAPSSIKAWGQDVACEATASDARSMGFRKGRARPRGQQAP